MPSKIMVSEFEGIGLHVTCLLVVQTFRYTPPFEVAISGTAVTDATDRQCGADIHPYEGLSGCISMIHVKSALAV